MTNFPPALQGLRHCEASITEKMILYESKAEAIYSQFRKNKNRYLPESVAKKTEKVLVIIILSKSNNILVLIKLMLRVKNSQHH